MPKTDRGPEYWLGEQRKWIQEHGGNAWGYQVHYAGAYAPAQIQEIYDADLGALKLYEERATLERTRVEQRAARARARAAKR